MWGGGSNIYETLLYSAWNLSTEDISLHRLLIFPFQDVYNLGKDRDGTFARLGKEQNFEPE